MDSEAFGSGLGKIFAGGGVGDGGEQTGALGERLPEEVDGAVFGDNPVDDGTRGDDARAFGQCRHDLAHALAGDGGHGHDGDAAFAGGSAEHEVELPAGAAEHLGADGIGADLPGEVDLDGGVEGHHLGISGDDGRIVGVGHVIDVYGGVVIDKVVEATGALEEGGDMLADVDLLGTAVDDAAFDERQHAVGEHLGVDTEVLVASELREHGVGDVANADLEGGAVGDKGGDVFADGDVLVAERGELGFEQRCVVPHERRDLRERDAGVAIAVGHVLVDLRDDVAGLLDGRQRTINGGAEGNEAVGVGFAHHDEHAVGALVAVADDAGGVGERTGNVVGKSGLGGFAHVAADEEGVEVETVGVLRQHVVGIPFSVEVCDVDVAQIGGAGHEGLDEKLGRGGDAGPVQAVARTDQLQCLGGSDVFQMGSVHRFWKLVVVDYLSLSCFRRAISSFQSISSGVSRMKGMWSKRRSPIMRSKKSMPRSPLPMLS